TRFSRDWSSDVCSSDLILLILAFIYYRYTSDTPAGNFSDLPQKTAASAPKKHQGSLLSALKDYRVWVLTLAYAAGFGIELTVDNVGALFFIDRFDTSLLLAGATAGLFGGINLLAPALRGIVSGELGRRFGLQGKCTLLGLLLVLEGIGIAFFAASGTLVFAVVSMLIFALFLKMANGCTYGIVPFINKDNMGAVSGIVGAGGNMGAMLVGF